MRLFWMTFCSVLCVLLFSACEVRDNGDSEIVIDVDDDFKISFLENLQTQDDDLYFQLESIRNKECENDTVILNIQNFGNALNINIDVLNTPLVCLTGQSLARTAASSGPLELASMPLSIKLENLVSNLGKIHINEDGFQVLMETDHGFYMPYNEIRRVPENAVWGYVGYSSDNSKYAQEFLDKFDELTDDFSPASGRYGYFNISDDKVIVVRGQLEQPMSTRAFIRGLKVVDTRGLRSLVLEYREKYPEMLFMVLDSYGNIL